MHPTLRPHFGASWGSWRSREPETVRRKWPSTRFRIPPSRLSRYVYAYVEEASSQFRQGSPDRECDGPQAAHRPAAAFRGPRAYADGHAPAAGAGATDSGRAAGGPALGQ